MNAGEWLKKNGVTDTSLSFLSINSIMDNYAKDYFQWKELQRSLIEDLTDHCSLAVLVNQFITAGEFHISHVFNFIWPTDEEQYQEYADLWEDFLSQDDIKYYNFTDNVLFPDLKRNPIVNHLMLISFNEAVTLRLYLNSNDPARLATIDFELVSKEYFKLKGIVL